MTYTELQTKLLDDMKYFREKCAEAIEAGDMGEAKVYSDGFSELFHMFENNRDKQYGRNL